MTKGERRRQRLGEDAVSAARDSARSAAPPDRALVDALTTLLVFQLLAGSNDVDQAKGQSA